MKDTEKKRKKNLSTGDLTTKSDQEYLIRRRGYLNSVIVIKSECLKVFRLWEYFGSETSLYLETVSGVFEEEQKVGLTVREEGFH